MDLVLLESAGILEYEKVEVVDIDNYRIDQLLVTRIDNKPTVLVPKLPDAANSDKESA